MPAPSDESGRGNGRFPRRKLYGRRKGPTLSARQTTLVETLLPRVQLQLRKGVDPAEHFGVAVDEVWLEIGFGAGEHLLWQAGHYPNIGIIGAEPYQSGVAKLLAKIDTLSEQEQADLIARIRIYPGDARDLIECVPDAALGRIFLLFPDPWPKKRHHKRRFLQHDTLGSLARTLKDGAELRFASDDSAYIAWALERVIALGAFTWAADSPKAWLKRPHDWPPTRYEQKALHGPPAFFSFVRRRRAAADLQFAAPKRK